MSHFLAAVLLPTAPAQEPDTSRLFRQARRAEVAYEASIRRYAPVSFRSAGDHRTCDEVVGRFCLYFDTGKEALPSEPDAVAVARDTAIAWLQRAAEAAPGRRTLAFPLVRFLIQDGRADQAEAVARAYARASPDTANAHMLLGYALHHARQTSGAAAHFDAWLKTLREDEQRHATSLDWLLEGRERKRYRRIPDADRAHYEERIWRFADPLYLTPGNELWTDHLARHALARMLSARPKVPYLESWGDDLEQLTVRFGAPAVTTRSRRAGTLGATTDYSEHWDPAQRIYFPPVLDSALAMPVRLDTIWPLENVTTRSGHAPPTIRSMRVLEHQAAVFGGSTPRFLLYGRAQVDTLVQRNAVAGTVFMLDSTLSVISQATATVSVEGDSAALQAELSLPSTARYYSAEIYDSASHFAARARYTLAGPLVSAPLAVSSIIFAEPFEPAQLPDQHQSPLLRPLNRAVITTGSRVGVYAEAVIAASERRTLYVEIENERVDRPSAIRRAVGWIGQRLGLANERSPARLGWNVDVEPGVVSALPLTLDLGPVDPGHYGISITVRDPVSGSEVLVRREIVVVGAEKVSSSTRP